MELNCVETYLKKKIAQNFNGRMITMGRVANLTGDKNLKKTVDSLKIRKL